MSSAENERIAANVAQWTKTNREFTDADNDRSAKVAIVNETFAKRFGLGANPVGKHMGIGSSDTLPLDMEIIGLVRDMKYSNVKPRGVAERQASAAVHASPARRRRALCGS